MRACMSGTRGSGVLSSTGDMLMRGVGREGGEWMRELGLVFTNTVGTGECWTCVCVLVAVVWVVYVGSGYGAWTRVGSVGVVLCLCEV